MPRIARIVVPGAPHLLAQRGNRSQRVFFSPSDRECYLRLLARQLSRHRVRLWAYRLDPCEVLLVVVPPDERSLGRALRNAHGQYSQTVNRRQGTPGHLFCGRFYSCPLDEECLLLAVRYLERFGGRLPPETHSSAAYRCRRRPAPEWLDDLPLPGGAADWRKRLRGPLDRGRLEHLLSRLRVGKPAGSERFVRRIERRTGLNLSRPRGRPRKHPVPP